MCRYAPRRSLHPLCRARCLRAHVHCNLRAPHDARARADRLATVIGDGAVGKTTLLIARTYKCFSQDYVPTVLDNFATIVDVGSRPLGIGTPPLPI